MTLVMSQDIMARLPPRPPTTLLLKPNRANLPNLKTLDSCCSSQKALDFNLNGTSLTPVKPLHISSKF